MTDNRVFSLVEKLNFVRVSGTEEEKRGAQIIADECASFGLESVIEEFPTQDGKVTKTVLEVLEPYHMTYTAIAHRRSGCVDIEAEVVYAEDALDVNLMDVKGKIILINTGVNKKNYEKILKAEPACVIVGNGSLLDKDDETDLLQGMLRPILTDDFDTRLCAMSVRMKDLFDMIVRGASKARVVIESEDIINTSRDVLAFIKGTRHPEEEIVFTAHMDSTECSHGVYDNAAGSAIIMEMARYFTQNPPARSVRFIWTGSEERGLLGSKYFVKEHADELEKVKLCINCDLAASPAGKEFAIVTGPEELTHHIDMMMKENGIPVEVRCDIYSSDNMPFADKGIPAVSMGRFGTPGMSYIHNRYDVMDYVCAKSINRTCDMVKLFAERMANCVMLPFEHKIPDNIRKKVDEYLCKKPADAAK